MHLPAALYLLGLSSIAFTAPAPTAPVLNTDLHIIQLSNHWPVYPGSSLARRQGLCNWDGYCKSAYYGCIKICASLTNGDCFDVQTSPECEGCRVKIAGC